MSDSFLEEANLANCKGLKSLSPKTLSCLLTYFSSKQVALIEELIESEILEGLAEREGLKRRFYLENVIDNTWELYMAGGVHAGMELCVQKGYLQGDIFDTLDEDENFYTEIQNAYEHLFKRLLIKTGVEASFVDELYQPL